ncbi:hypothetical protein ABPG74_019644 [Tetrahymena malaccensis]
MIKDKQFKLYTIEYCKSLQNQYKQAQSPATLKGVQQKCQIINNILKTNLSQTFVSQSSSEYSETIYYFPIINGTCLELFEATYNEKTIKGVIKEKSEAKKEYLENKDQGNFISYAQTSTQDDQQYCEIYLGNLPPNQQIEIKITFSQQLSSILNKYFVAQIPLQYCEDDISAKLGMNVLTLDLVCTGKITYAESRRQKVEKIVIDDNTIRFNLSQDNIQKQAEFQLIFSFEGMFEPQVILGQSRIFHEDQVKSAILPVSNSVMISFIPNFNEEITQDLDDAVRAALIQGEDIFGQDFQQKMNSELVDHLNSSRSDFIFFLDRSGSMSGEPIQQACEALILFLKSLPTDSYFNVVSFGSTFQRLFPSSQKYNSQNLEKAINIISKYSADLGCTAIYEPLSEIFYYNIQGYNKQIFLFTDGQVDFPEKVVNLIKNNNKFNRIHSIGFGSGADKNLIKETAIAGKGISRIVNMNCDLSEVIIEILSLCITPTFDEFKVSYDKNIFESTYPSSTDFPCIFKDEIINIHLFFKPLVQVSELTQEQKQIEIEYYDSHQKKKVQKKLILQMQDSFSCNSELQQSVFKIGKQLQLNEMLDNQQEQNDKLLKESIDYQLLTQKTALICIIETLNDEQKIVYEIHKPIQKEPLPLKQNNQYNSYPATAASQQYQVEEDDFDCGGDLFDDCGSYGFVTNVSKSPNPQISQQPKIEANSSKETKKYECCSPDEEEKNEEFNQLGDIFYQSFSSPSNYANQKNDGKVKEAQGVTNNSKPSLENLLNLVDSQGVWKYDETFIKRCCNKIDSAQIKQCCSNFINQNAFMTMIVMVLLELKYSQQINKWKLISKKSTNYVKSQIIEGVSFDSLKETIKKQFFI